MGNEKMIVAKTILAQLGGNRFLVMTGAKNLGADKNYLSFKIGRNKSKGAYVRITLNSMDTYDMEFIKIRKADIKTMVEKNGIYAEDLQRVFTDVTGIHTRL